MTFFTLTNLAIIFIAIHVFVGIFVPLVLMYFSMRGMMLANRKTREVMPLVQQYARQAAEGTEAVSQRIAEPVVKIYGFSNRWQTSWQRATNRPRTHSADRAAPDATEPATQPDPAPSNPAMKG
jgi:hypothetical protein